jgi:hypothetical protein
MKKKIDINELPSIILQSEKERCPCCGEYIGDLDCGQKICSCDTGDCTNCHGENSILKNA